MASENHPSKFKRIHPCEKRNLCPFLPVAWVFLIASKKESQRIEIF